MQSRSPYKARVDQDQKDLLIAQLKAENFELKQKERDYGLLNSQLLDLEHRFKLLQEEKFRAERDAKEREDLMQNKADLLQTEIRRLTDTAGDKQKALKDTNVELTAYKDLLAEKNAETSRLRDELIRAKEENEFLGKDNRALESDLDLLREGRRRAEMEVTRLKELNDNLIRSHDAINAKERDSALEVARLRRRLEDLENELSVVQKERSERETDLDIARDGKRTAQRDLDRLLETNGKLKDENRLVSERIRGLELEIAKLSQRFDDSSTLLDAKEKELRSVRSGISYAEDKGLEANAELTRVKKENDTLQLLLDKYRGDAEFQKKLREEEARKKLELEQEKKRLEREALNKELEARTAKRELEEVQGVHEKLLDDRVQLSEELEALRQHAGLLESQNKNLHRELETFVDTDERVRRELDRKDRVDYIKGKNQEEYEKSITKVRTSLSPAKRGSPLKDYKSPGKYY